MKKDGGILNSYFLSALRQSMSLILLDGVIKEDFEAISMEPKPIGTFDSMEQAIINIMDDYYRSRFHNPSIFAYHRFKNVKNLYPGKDDKLYYDLHKEQFVELVRNVLFYMLCSSKKFDKKTESSVNRSKMKKLLAKQLDICKKIGDEIKTDKTKPELYVLILRAISAGQMEHKNFTERVHEIACSLSYDCAFKADKHRDYVNLSCIPVENLLNDLADLYFESMMEILDFRKKPLPKMTEGEKHEYRV